MNLCKFGFSIEPEIVHLVLGILDVNFSADVDATGLLAFVAFCFFASMTEE